MANGTIIQKTFKVAGINGDLFSVTDDLTGVIHSVSDISGIPIFKIEDDGAATFSGKVEIKGILHLSNTATSGDVITMNISGGGWQYLLDARSPDGLSRFNIANTLSSGTDWAVGIEARTVIDNSCGLQFFSQHNATTMGTCAAIEFDARRNGTGPVGDTENAIIFSTGTRSLDLLTIKGNGDATFAGIVIADEIHVTDKITGNASDLYIESASGKEVITSSARNIINIIDNNDDDTTNMFRIQANVAVWDPTFAADVFTVSQTGTVTADGNITALDFILASDRTLKDNIKTIREGVDDFGLDVVYKEFEYKHDKGRKRAGIIANDIQAQYPELCHVNHRGELSVSYIDLLIREVAGLKNQVRRLKIRLGNHIQNS